jgi:hypothetical protein
MAQNPPCPFHCQYCMVLLTSLPHFVLGHLVFLVGLLVPSRVVPCEEQQPLERSDMTLEFVSSLVLLHTWALINLIPFNNFGSQFSPYGRRVWTKFFQQWYSVYLLQEIINSQAWWYMPIIPTLSRLRQEKRVKFEACLGYTVRPHLKKKLWTVQQLSKLKLYNSFT